MYPDKTFFVFAGPNGSGKSSIIANFSNAINNLNYYCADEIAKEDVFITISDENTRNYQAMLEVERRVRDALDASKPVAYETVLSSDYKWPILEYARTKGYFIVSVFVSTDNPEINVARVHNRVSAGGHSVPDDKVRKRYSRSLSRLGKLLTYSDEAHAYDNSKDGQGASTVLVKIEDSIYYDHTCKWVTSAILGWQKSSVEETRHYRIIPANKITE